jgi:hypothetical protein
MGDLTVSDGSLDPGERQVLLWWISLPFRMLLFIVGLLFKGLLRLQTVLKKE